MPALVVACMCGGDGAADLVGRHVRSPRLPWNRAKSVAGSLAMLATSTAMGAGLLLLFARWRAFALPDPAAAVAAAAATALAATAVESLPVAWAVDDNLSVPAVAAAAGWWLFLGGGG